MQPASPVVTFYRMIDSAKLPERADRSALGSLPTRAFRYCDAVSQAAGFGWYVSVPIDLELMWDGRQIWWRCEGLEDWLPLSAAQYPHFADRFAQAAPDGLAEYAPPFLTALQEPGLVQIWTGLAARTAPGWSLLVRSLCNFPRYSGLEPFEGLVEADRWFGPIFTNFRLTRTGMPVTLRAGEPLLQVQPIPQVAYSDAVLGGARMVDSLESFGPEDWASYEATLVTPSLDPARQQGAYALEGRKRRKSGCPFAAAAANGIDLAPV